MIHKQLHPLNQAETRERIVHSSPYLTRLLDRHPDIWDMCWQYGAEATVASIEESIENMDGHESKQWMQLMRVGKQRMALAIAVADISRTWDVDRVTSALSDYADRMLQLALQMALKMHSMPNETSGLAMFALGKLGAHSLNYSSDIDILAIFDPDMTEYMGDKSLQNVMNKIVQDTITLLEERTQEGYIFRTDLRLRPDPSSTPIAVNLGGALSYYESVGQNWERAAFTKCRFVAGDKRVGETFIKEIRPFLWRKHLDFAAIDDIHSIKRQMHTGTGEISTARKHNVKTGRGGIREIEFYVQTQQLVWGGRMPELRVRGTIDTLHKLVEAELVEHETAKTLESHYYFLREVEHRLQMVNDQQTHSIPNQDDELERFALFMGYPDTEAMLEEILATLREVHRLFLDSMRSTPPLGKEDGYLVFTGSDPDADTLETLSGMGYAQPRTVWNIVQGWHRGNRRATKSKRARQVLTEIVPSILKSMATTSHPDQAFIRFDDFLSQLPSGIQIFSLMAAHVSILETLATVMGSAPALGETLGRYPTMLEAIIHSDFTRLPTAEEIEQLLRPQLRYANDYEDVMRILRNTRSEREFQAGVALLKGTSAREVNGFLSELAEDIVQEILHHTHAEFAARYGVVADGSFAIVALGKLGAGELTFGSDLDVFFIYDAPTEAESDGEHSLVASVYYNRLAQRIVSGLTSLTREGRLYEVDSRMRPLGAEGPLACKLSMFEQYFGNAAWTFERMALCKARVIASDNDNLTKRITDIREHILSKPHNTQMIYQDASNMRRKIAEQFRNNSGWHIKHGMGGTIDLDFIAQSLLLTNAAKHPSLIQYASESILAEALRLGLLEEAHYQELSDALIFQRRLQTILRLCTNESITRDKTPAGLRVLLQQRFELPDIKTLYAELLRHQMVVRELFESHIALATDAN